jgi:hypothetical protein
MRYLDAFLQIETEVYNRALPKRTTGEIGGKQGGIAEGFVRRYCLRRFLAEMGLTRTGRLELPSSPSRSAKEHAHCTQFLWQIGAHSAEQHKQHEVLADLHWRLPPFFSAPTA